MTEITEAGQFVGPLDGIGGVGVIAHRAAVASDLGLQAIATFPYPAQLGGDALACLIGKPRGLDFFAHLRRPVFPGATAIATAERLECCGYCSPNIPTRPTRFVRFRCLNPVGNAGAVLAHRESR
jgi:hypothetical protein